MAVIYVNPLKHTFVTHHHRTAERTQTLSFLRYKLQLFKNLFDLLQLFTLLFAVLWDNSNTFSTLQK